MIELRRNQIIEDLPREAGTRRRFSAGIDRCLHARFRTSRIRPVVSGLYRRTHKL